MEDSILQRAMSVLGIHTATNKTETCNLQPLETHIVSLCVALTFGAIGGLSGVAASQFFTTIISMIIYGGWIYCSVAYL